MRTSPFIATLFLVLCIQVIQAQVAASSQVTLTSSVKKILSDNGIEFIAPDGYTTVPMVKNEQMNYDFAMKSDEVGMEVRYVVHPDKNASGDNATTNMTVALNISKVKNPASLKTSAFPEASARDQFNSDAGGVFFVEAVDPGFSTSYPSCLMLYLNKKNVGNVYAFLLFNQMNQSAMNAPMYAIKFADLGAMAAEAVEDNDLARLKELLAKGANPNTRDGFGQSLLHRSIPTNGTETAQDIELVKTLLTAGANPNFTSGMGATPLHTAAFYGLPKITQALLDKGADPTVISTIGDNNTPAKMALSNNKNEMAKMLQALALKFPAVPVIGMDSKLTYGVDFYGKKYKFIMDIVQDDPEIVINWKMTLDNRDDKSGNISMSAEAVQKATAQYNLFENGEIVLDDKTSVWVSRAVFKSLRTGAETVMNAMGKDKTFTRKNIPAGTEVTVDGKAINVIYAEASDGSEKFWILNNPKMPLILKMDLGWKIGIEKIESQP